MPYKDQSKQKQAQAEYARRKSAKRRALAFAGQVCADCGIAEQLKLVDKERGKLSYRGIYTGGLERLNKILTKADLVCAACARIRQLALVKHGKRYTYEYHGCRCVPCTEAMRARTRDWKKMWRARKRDRELQELLKRRQALIDRPEDIPLRKAIDKAVYRARIKTQTDARGRTARSIPDDELLHGTKLYYFRGCRCDRCKKAYLEYSRNIYRRRMYRSKMKYNLDYLARPDGD